MSLELEDEINDLRKLLHLKLQELSKLKATILSTNSNPALPKWAVERYSRQILLEEISVGGQKSICDSAVLIVGAGGLGSPAALYLAGAGVGHIGIVDYDTVDITNLHRQILHPESWEGLSKVASAAEAIRRINSRIHVSQYNTQLSSSNVLGIVQDYDVVLDASDNVVTRYLLNDACFFARRPLVSGSALKMEGQLTVYDHRPKKDTNTKGPCYRCLFAVPPPPDSVASCSQAGVCGPVCGVIGSLQALEAIKIIINRPREDIMVGRMLVYDGCAASFRTIKLRPANPKCGLCSSNPTIDKLIDYEVFCNAKATDKDLDLKILDATERISAEDYALLCKMHLGDGDRSNLALVDVRSTAEYEMCHIPGSVNCPIDDFKTKLDSIITRLLTPMLLKVVFICRRGNDSQLAVRQFKDGLKRQLNTDNLPEVFDVIGGLHAWAKSVDQNFPIY